MSRRSIAISVNILVQAYIDEREDSTTEVTVTDTRASFQGSTLGEAMSEAKRSKVGLLVAESALKATLRKLQEAELSVKVDTDAGMASA
jgi:hypothetical protein